MGGNKKKEVERKATLNFLVQMSTFKLHKDQSKGEKKEVEGKRVDDIKTCKILFRLLIKLNSFLKVHAKKERLKSGNVFLPQ